MSNRSKKKKKYIIKTNFLSSTLYRTMFNVKDFLSFIIELINLLLIYFNFFVILSCCRNDFGVSNFPTKIIIKSNNRIISITFFIVLNLRHDYFEETYYLYRRLYEQRTKII